MEYAPYLLLAVVVMHVVDRVFTAWSLRAREVETGARLEKATASLAEAWAANAKLTESIAQRDAVILAYHRKPAPAPRKGRVVVEDAPSNGHSRELPFVGTGRIPH